MLLIVWFLLVFAKIFGNFLSREDLLQIFSRPLLPPVYRLPPVPSQHKKGRDGGETLSLWRASRMHREKGETVCVGTERKSHLLLPALREREGEERTRGIPPPLSLPLLSSPLHKPSSSAPHPLDRRGSRYKRRS